MSDLKNLVVNNRMAYFTEYRDGNLWYCVEHKNFEFPVPVEDAKGAIFPARIKAITLMRWIRKHLELAASEQD